jgi:predicted Zn-dependent protease
MTGRKLLASLLIAAHVATVAALPVLAQADRPASAPIQPEDKIERGLWLRAEDLERELKGSPFVMRDERLNKYVRDVFCRTVPDHCSSVRIYILRSPEVNAATMPNGVMLVFSGLLLRLQNEAQLAAILGHEFTHFSNHHALRIHRDLKTKANAATVLSVIPVPGLGAVAAISLAQIALIGSAYTFSREMEREADAGSVPLLARAGYDPIEAHKFWAQIRAEADATAAARNTQSRKDKGGGIFATHPGSAERLDNLKQLAAGQQVGPDPVVARNAYYNALIDHLPDFVDDQIKLNDLGGTDLLLTQLAGVAGWTPALLFARGELYRARGTPGDLAKAAGFYREAVASPTAPNEAWRGLGLALLRSGQENEARSALKAYLERRPDAKDRAMIAMLAGEQK